MESDATPGSQQKIHRALKGRKKEGSEAGTNCGFAAAHGGRANALPACGHQDVRGYTSSGGGAADQ